MKSKKSKPLRGFITVVVSVIMMLYIGYQAYRSIFSEIETELAVTHSVYETIDVQGLAFRYESIVSTTGSGYTYYSVDNGTRVAKYSVIASVYDDAESGRIEQEMNKIDTQINAFNTILADTSSGRLTLDGVNTQISDAIYDLVQNTETGMFESVEDAQFSLLSLLSKKQLVTGQVVDLSKKIQELKDEKAKLKADYKAASAVIKAPVAGYFADRTDGFESILNPEFLSEITVQQLENHFKSEPQIITNSGGKIVSGYEWYMACVVPDSYYNVLSVGKSLSLQLSFVLDEAVPVTVYSCNKDNNGKMAVVFRCDYMSAELSTIRQEPVQIQLVKHTGLKVPKRAIIIDENQQAGVYVRSGNIVSFRKINQLFSEPADYVICEEVSENGYLKMYDDIIVGGRDLYDGKIVR